MFNLNERYTMAQLVELIGTDKQKKHFEKYKTFKSAPMKKALLKELETMVKYELIKGRPQYYLITEIYEEQKEKEDKRKENRIIYPKAKDLLIYNLFENNDFKKELYFNPKKVMIMAGLANKNFDVILYNKKDYAKKIGVDPKIFSSAIDSKYSECRYKINTALNQLKKENIIENWREVIYIIGANKAVIDNGIPKILLNQDYELDLETERLFKTIRNEVAEEYGYKNFGHAMQDDKKRTTIRKKAIEEFNKKSGLNIQNFETRIGILRLDKELLEKYKPKTYNKILNEQVMELCKREMEKTYKILKQKGIDIEDIILSKNEKEKIKNDVKTSVKYLNIVEII